MKRNIIILFIIILSLLFYTMEYLNKDTTVKIGFVGTLTGTSSELSVTGRRGVELAIKEFNRKSNIKFELVVKDDEANDLKSKEVAQEFINENIKYVIGHYTSGMQASVIDIIDQNNILYLSPTVSGDNFSQRDDNLIRFIDVTSKQGEVLFTEAMKDKKNRVAIVYDERNIGFSDSLVRSIENMISKSDIKLLLKQGFSDNFSKDVDNLVLKLSELDIDAVFIISSSSENIILHKAIEKFGAKIDTYSPLWSNTVDFQLKGGDSVIGAHLISMIPKEFSSRDYNAFVEIYRESYGSDPTFSSVFSYEVAIALLTAISEESYNNFEEVKKYIIMKKYNGLINNFEIDEYGDCNRLYYVQEVTK